MTELDLKKEANKHLNNGQREYGLGMQYVLNNLESLENAPNPSTLDSRSETIFALESTLQAIVAEIEEYQKNKKYTKDRFLGTIHTMLYGEENE